MFVPDLTVIEDKLLVHRVLKGVVRTPEVYATIAEGACNINRALPPLDIFVKCCNQGASGGQGHHFLQFEGNGLWRSDFVSEKDGTLEYKRYSTAHDFACDLQSAERETLLPSFQLQEALVNHDRIAALIAPAKAFCTLRLTTIRLDDKISFRGKEQRRCMCTAGLIRFPQQPGAFVDNWHAGGMVVGIDFSRGTVHKKGFGDGTEGGTFKLANGACFGGFLIPFWKEAKQCAEKAHMAFVDATGLDIVRFGSDVGITNDGPVFVEFNGMADARGQAIYGYEKADGIYGLDGESMLEVERVLSSESTKCASNWISDMVCTPP